MALKGISHLGIGVSDLDRSVAFYRDVLGCVVVDRYGYQVPADPDLPNYGNARPDARWWREVAVLRVGTDPGDPVLVMSLRDRGLDAHRVEIDDVGTHHWAIWVEDIDQYVARLDAAGVEWSMPLRTFESSRAWGLPTTVMMRSLMFRDPDGTIIQLDEKVPRTG